MHKAKNARKLINNINGNADQKEGSRRLDRMQSKQEHRDPTRGINVVWFSGF
jgi:phage shock protein A